MTKEQLQYLDSGCIYGSDRLIALISPALAYRKNAGKIAGSHSSPAEIPGSTEINTGPYIYNHPVVLRIAAYLQSNLYHDVFGAYVHGSTATGEMIPYSDFDGLIIVKDDVLKSKSRLLRLAKHLRVTRLMMHELDPLQHHGWTLFSEADLKSYNTCKFPVELFGYAASLLDKGQSFHVSVAGCNHHQPFNELAAVIKKKAGSRAPRSLYAVKSLLSEFMLLPALYIQARTGKGIFKKFSFREASADFTEREWNCMNEVSSIRQHWNYSVSVTAESRALRFSAVSGLAGKMHTPAPPELRRKVAELLPQMAALVAGMSSKVNS